MSYAPLHPRSKLSEDGREGGDSEPWSQHRLEGGQGAGMALFGARKEAGNAVGLEQVWFLLGMVLLFGIIAWVTDAVQHRALAGGAERYGLHFDPASQTLSGPNFHLQLTVERRTFFTSSSASMQMDRWADFRLTFPSWPLGLLLFREGAASAQAAAAGQREWVSGNADFDDLFWVAAPHFDQAAAYLTEARQTLLVHALWDFDSTGAMGNVLEGRRRLSVWEVTGLVDRLARLSLLNQSGPFTVQGRSPGWINRAQRQRHAGAALGLSCLTLVVGGLVAYCLATDPGFANQLNASVGAALAGLPAPGGAWAVGLTWLTLALLLSGSLLLLPALGLQANLAVAPRVLRWVLRLVQMVATAPPLLIAIWAAWHGEIAPWFALCGTLVLGLLLFFAFWAPLDAWRWALLRLRCGGR